MSPADALMWVREVQLHVSGGMRLVGHHLAGETPNDFDIVAALGASLAGAGRALDKAERSLT